MTSSNSISAVSHPSDVVLKVDGVSKKFCRNLKQSMIYGIKDLACNLTGIREDTSSLRKDEFWAVKDISFELRRGETLGLIGKNGSGKSSLLRILAGIFPPDIGQVSVKGRTAALIALGAGFHPHLTGMENIFLNGTILGLTQKRIKSCLDDIIDFSEIEEFIHAPVSTYSSGMRVRLGFAIATAIKPDLLLVDEVLAVGDRRFRTKSYNRLKRMMDESAVIFVSHSMVDITRICTEGLVLERGQTVYKGNVPESIRRYQALNNVEVESYVVSEPEYSHLNLQISQSEVEWGDALTVIWDFNSTVSMSAMVIRIVFTDETDVVVGEWKSANVGVVCNVVKGTNSFSAELKSVCLRNDKYRVSAILAGKDGMEILLHAHSQCVLSVTGEHWGNVPYILK